MAGILCSPAFAAGGMPQGNRFGVDDAVSLGVGFTPAGIAFDICTAAKAKDCITGDEVKGFWRWAGLVPFASELRKGGKVIDAALDGYRKVHGELPLAQDLGRYSVDELTRLRNELQVSVQTRIQTNERLGPDAGHINRLVDEQQLIQSIEKHLKDR